MRWLLAPLSWLYALVTALRNWLYDTGLKSAVRPQVPTICVGNLAVGGTGKTPHTEYIVRLLCQKYHVAILSRGYGRQTKGFVLADATSTAQTIGDEPMQMHTAFPDVPVAVSEKRALGLQKLLQAHPQVQVVVLDDAFQHRQVQAGFSILITQQGHLYVHDHLMPRGRLRELPRGSRRADMVVVSKCPQPLTGVAKEALTAELRLQQGQTLCCSQMAYQPMQPVFAEGEPLGSFSASDTSAIVLTGIAHPQAMQHYLQPLFACTKCMIFRDHHSFSQKDFVSLQTQWAKLPTTRKLIVTTEKDAARLRASALFPEMLKPWVYALPIVVDFGQDTELFNSKIEDYVERNNRNR